jgi:hypothetical protein
MSSACRKFFQEYSPRRRRRRRKAKGGFLKNLEGTCLVMWPVKQAVSVLTQLKFRIRAHPRLRFTRRGPGYPLQFLEPRGLKYYSWWWNFPGPGPCHMVLNDPLTGSRAFLGLGFCGISAPIPCAAKKWPPCHFLASHPAGIHAGQGIPAGC